MSIPIYKWKRIMRLPIWQEDRYWRWRAQMDAYRGENRKMSKYIPTAEWVRKDRLLHPLNSKENKKNDTIQ